jgi:hypothetical protein
MSKNHNKAENLQKTAEKRMPQNARRMPQSDDIIATKTKGNVFVMKLNQIFFHV